MDFDFDDPKAWEESLKELRKRVRKGTIRPNGMPDWAIAWTRSAPLREEPEERWWRWLMPRGWW